MGIKIKEFRGGWIKNSIRRFVLFDRIKLACQHLHIHTVTFCYSRGRFVCIFHSVFNIRYPPEFEDFSTRVISRDSLPREGITLGWKTYFSESF